MNVEDQAHERGKWDPPYTRAQSRRHKKLSSLSHYIKRFTDEYIQKKDYNEVYSPTEENTPGRRMLREVEMQVAKNTREDNELNALRSMSFCPREERNMPFDHKVIAWLDKIFLPTFVITTSSGETGEEQETRPTVQCKIKKPYPPTSSDTASDESEAGQEQHNWRLVTRQVLAAYRNEGERAPSVFQGKRQGPAWHSKFNGQIEHLGNQTPSIIQVAQTAQGSSSEFPFGNPWRPILYPGEASLQTGEKDYPQISLEQQNEHEINEYVAYDYREELRQFGNRGAYYSTELNGPIRRMKYGSPLNHYG